MQHRQKRLNPIELIVAVLAILACLDAFGNPRSIGSLEREAALYFGAHEGALHRVSACTREERIANVPNAVFSSGTDPEPSKPTSINHARRYDIDGPATVLDAFWSGAWHKTLVGTLRDGGKGVFALDVTDPSTLDETHANQALLWEIKATPLVVGSDFEELGYPLSQPAIVEAEGHGWVAVFGNGYDSASGKALLYIVRINDGTLLRSIDLSDVNVVADGGGNGLSTVSPIDTDGNGLVDLIYGGDLKGNLWRFKATAGVGFAPGATSLLYSAKSVQGEEQPITSRMAVGYHPTSAVGRIVYFGTGKPFPSGGQGPDAAVELNTMYGIWDRDNGQTVTSVTTRNSKVLQQQTIELQDSNAFGSNQFEIRVVSDTPVTWATPTGSCAVDSSCGWYIDLIDTRIGTNSGETIAANPLLRSGRLSFVTTTPSLQSCRAGVTRWLMELNPYTGGRLDFPVFDLNGDGVFDFNDNLSSMDGDATVSTPVSGRRSKVGTLQPPAIPAGFGSNGDGGYGSAGMKNSSGTNNAQIDITIKDSGILRSDRESWVQVR
jgi:type IV pilus assembly protein PilY1